MYIEDMKRSRGWTLSHAWGAQSLHWVVRGTAIYRFQHTNYASGLCSRQNAWTLEVRRPSFQDIQAITHADRSSWTVLWVWTAWTAEDSSIALEGALPVGLRIPLLLDRKTDTSYVAWISTNFSCGGSRHYFFRVLLLVASALSQT